MDLRGLPIESDPFSQWTAIRSLSYDSAGKVAIKFKTAWWTSEGNMNKHGGVSTTDSPIRVTVYPSWMDTDDPTEPAVLIATCDIYLASGRNKARLTDLPGITQWRIPTHATRLKEPCGDV